MAEHEQAVSSTHLRYLFGDCFLFSLFYFIFFLLFLFLLFCSSFSVYRHTAFPSTRRTQRKQIDLKFKFKCFTSIVMHNEFVKRWKKRHNRVAEKKERTESNQIELWQAMEVRKMRKKETNNKTSYTRDKRITNNRSLFNMCVHLPLPFSFFFLLFLFYFILLENKLFGRSRIKESKTKWK